MRRFLFCLLSAALLSISLSACETIPSEPRAEEKSVDISTTHTSEAVMPLMTPVMTPVQSVPHCERFMSSIDQAEQKISAQPTLSMTVADAL
jgi:hypothetical protein